MNIEVLQEELLKGYAVAMRAVSSRVQLPILSAIKMEATKAELVLSATDLEIGIKLKISARVLEEGKVAVPAKTFGELLATLAPGKVKLELKDNNLRIEAGNFVGKLGTMEVTEFPELPSAAEAITEISAAELSRAGQNVGFASAKETLRPVLTGILMELSQNLRLVATDGFRLAVSSMGIKGSALTKPQTILVPARALIESSKIIKEGVIKLGYLAETKQVVFGGEQVTLVSQIIEGNFPDYNKILPKEFGYILEVSREELLAAVRTVQVFARDNSNMMRWKVEKGKVQIMAAAGGSGEGQVEVSAKTEGEGELEVVFNAKYVLDYLMLGGSESVWIGLGGKLSPGLMAESEAGKDKAFYVVMPINA